MSESSSDEPKIIVDTDWKAQAQAEKEKLQKELDAKSDTESESAESETPNESASSVADSESEPTGESSAAGSEDAELPEFPEASFPMLVSSLMAQAAMSLGQIPDPIEQKTSVNKPLAKHVIDMLAMLQEKTKGNLTDEESRMMIDVLHQLRMAYLALG